MNSIKALFLVAGFLFAWQTFASPKLMVYSARKKHLIEPVFKAFTEQTGVQVEFLTADAGPLLVRIETEKAQSPADLFLTVDAGNLWQVADKNLFEPVKSQALQSAIPASLRDSKNRWFSLSLRARTMVYNTQKVQASELIGYEDLGQDKWKGKLCIRSANHVYNQSLVAQIIAQKGEKKAKEIVEGWKKNLAAAPFSSDTLVLEALATGQCQVGIVNSYYYGKFKDEKKEAPVAIAWPKDANSLHVNVSGAGVLKTSKNKELAIKFLEWVTKPESQKLFAELNWEFPANPKASLRPEMNTWGFKLPNFPLEKLGANQKTAVEILSQTGLP